MTRAGEGGREREKGEERGDRGRGVVCVCVSFLLFSLCIALSFARFSLCRVLGSHAAASAAALGPLEGWRKRRGKRRQGPTVATADCRLLWSLPFSLLRCPLRSFSVGFWVLRCAVRPQCSVQRQRYKDREYALLCLAIMSFVFQVVFLLLCSSLSG